MFVTMSEAPAKAAPQGAMQFVIGLARDWGIALLVVIGVFFAYNLLFPGRAPALGPAPDFTLANLEGQAVKMSALSGEHDLVVLNFWFTTCPPCRAEIPHLSEFARAHPDVPIYGVSTDINLSPGRLRKESERLGIDYPVLHDLRAAVARSYGVEVFPTTLVIRDMEIVQARVGGVDRAALEAMVDAAR
jgi:peroxiredoxin